MSIFSSFKFIVIALDNCLIKKCVKRIHLVNY